MTRASKGKKIGARSEYWRERIAEQGRSGMSVQRFCEEQGLTEQSFYLWRKRLRKQPPMRFALAETGPALPQRATELALLLVVTTGERVRIGAGREPTWLRSVMATLRQ